MAAWLRLAGVTELSVRFDDEAAYAADARLWYRCLLFLTDAETWDAIVGGQADDLAALQDRYAIDLSTRYPKPCQGYTAPVALLMLLTGDTPNAAFVFNALVGIATVLVVYGLGSAAAGRGVGLAAAAMLAVSPYHVVYGRSALADGSATFFLLLAAWLWAITCRRRVLPRWGYGLCGLALGWAAACHFRSMALATLLVTFDALTVVPTGQARPTWSARAGAFWRRWRWGAMGFVAVPLLLELSFRTARYTAVALGCRLPLATFAEAWWYWMRLSIAVERGRPGEIIHPDVLQVLASCVAHWQGILWAGVCAVGCLALGAALCRRAMHGTARLLCRRPPGIDLRKSRARPLLLAVFILAVFPALMLFQPNTVARTFAPLVPLACLCAAAGVEAFVQLLALRRLQAAAVRTVLVLLLVADLSLRSGRATEPPGDIPAACDFVARHGGAVAVPTGLKYALYWQGPGDGLIAADRFHAGPEPSERLHRLRQEGVRWLICDPQYFHYDPDGRLFKWWDRMNRLLRTSAPPAAQFEHLLRSRWSFLAEGPGPQRLEDAQRAHAGPIRVYDLTHIPFASHRLARREVDVVEQDELTDVEHEVAGDRRNQRPPPDGQ
ncbi:MAG: phospholipid carrier-dependent glycosyltransferase [Phycisphaerales bacterium]|nr:MAG: phospholipid carrier-dependent glycosyltransferase [Phycisphaerales bacterium]